MTELDVIRGEINKLAAETMAHSAIIGFCFNRLAALNPSFAGVLRLGFDDAANFIEQEAIVRGTRQRPTHLVEALEVIERLRATALKGHEKPQHGI